MKISGEQIALAYLTSPTVAEAARSLGRTRQWFYKQLQREDVQQALANYRQQVAEHAVAVLTSLVEEAASVLVELLRTGSERTQLEAAKWVLENFLFRRDNDTLEIVE